MQMEPITSCLLHICCTSSFLDVLEKLHIQRTPANSKKKNIFHIHMIPFPLKMTIALLMLRV